ncbi:MAG TPA: SDR family oxidoreductase [Myxococcaceae bacterium]|nr:SDR family oxidoreductase [Myxococcaceae bacterium]
MILVTGGTGTVGSEVVKQLVAAGQKVRVLARNPAKAEKLQGVETVAADMMKPETLPPALKGVEKIFLLGTGPDLPQQEANVIDAAKQAGGIKHVVKLSVIGADFEPGIQLGRTHRESEKRLEASGLPWTHLRPSGFMTNDFGWMDSVKGQGAVYNPTADGKGGVIDPRDIAAVAVKALTGSGHEGKAYTLTGPEALSVPERVAALSKAVGRELKVIDVTVDQAAAGMSQSGMPQVLVEMLREYLNILRAGHGAVVTPDVQNLLGKARRYEDWARDNAGAFK